MKKNFLFVSALSFVSLSVQAESLTGGLNNNPFSNTAPTGNSAPRNVGDSAFFSSPSNIIDNSAGNSQNGLEFKLNDANRQAMDGANAAGVSGGLLTGAAVAALAASQYVRAGVLFGMAGQEFAQMRASSKTALENAANRGTLLANANQNGQQGLDSGAMANALLTPQAQSALEAQGIQPASFMNNLVNGNIQSGSQALAALGQTLTPEAAEAANDYSSVDLTALGGAENLGDEYRSLLGIKDDVMPQSADISHGSAGYGGGTLDTANGTSAPSSAATSASLRGVGTAAPGSVAKPGANALAEKFNFNGMSNMSEIFSAFGQGKELDPAAMALLRAELLTLGVSKTKGQTIFRLANRNFRSFNKWRVQKQAGKKPERGLASVVD